VKNALAGGVKFAMNLNKKVSPSVHGSNESVVSYKLSRVMG